MMSVLIQNAEDGGEGPNKDYAKQIEPEVKGSKID